MLRYFVSQWHFVSLLCVVLFVGCDSGPKPGLSPELAKTAAKLEANGAVISLTDNMITGIDFYTCEKVEETVPLLAGLTSIEELNFSSVPVTDALLAPLKELKNLKHIALNQTLITDDGLTLLAGLDQLEVVNLNGTQVSDAGLAHLSGLTNLRGLALYRTAITDDGLAQLEGLVNLEWMQLSGPGVTEAGVEKLKNALPNIDVTYRADPPDNSNR